ncbi:MAG: tetratricopeptide repeat protein [Candidatus Zixiibacteriota bacterium]
MLEFVKKYKMPLMVFGAAFLIRLIYLIQAQSNPMFYHPMIDELWNLNWAREINGGNFWGDTAYFRGPLYPYLLALFLKIGGDSLFIARLFQILISAGSATVLYLLGMKLTNRTIGIISAGAYTLYGTLMMYESMFLIPVLFNFLNILGIYLMISHRREFNIKKWLIIGIVFGLSAITRPNIMLIVPLFIIWIYFGFSDIKELKKRLMIPAIYLLGILIPVLSVTIRNYAVADEFILISSQGGVNFYIGNNPEAEGLTMLMPEIDLNESISWSQFIDATRSAAEKEAGHSLTASEESSFWSKKAWGYILGNPFGFIELTYKKLIYFLTGFENSDQTDIYQTRQYSSLLSILLWKKIFFFPFGILFPLAIVGVINLWKRRKDFSLLYIFIVGYIPTVILFLVTARHRLPVIPFMIILAVAGGYAFFKATNRKDWSTFTKLVIPFMVLLVFSNQTYFEIGFENEFQTHYNLALTYKRQGNLPMAEKEYKEALLKYPESAVALNSLGYIQFEMGKTDEASDNYRRALRIDPNYAEAYNNIGLILESRADYENALQYYRRAVSLDSNLYQAYLNIGDVYLSQNNLPQAESAYNQALAKAADNSAPYFKLGALYARMQRFAEAEQMFINGSRHGEPRAIDCLNWGNIYYSTDQANRAFSMYYNAIKKDSTLMPIYINMAAAFKNLGFPADSSIKYLNQALRINPNYDLARQMLREFGQ